MSMRHKPDPPPPIKITRDDLRIALLQHISNVEQSPQSSDTVKAYAEKVIARATANREEYLAASVMFLLSFRGFEDVLEAATYRLAGLASKFDFETE